MADRPVHWHEGMFLRPQHFQAADRYWSNQLAAVSNWDNPYNYGIRRIRISPEALSNFQIEVAECQARLPDGTLVEFMVGEDPDRVSFKHEAVTLEGAFDEQATIRVYLAVPRLRLGHSNVACNGDTADLRYSESMLQVADESSGGQDQEIAFRELNLKVLLSTQDLSGYEALPVGQLRRGADEAGTPELDENYFPPLVSVDAWPPLGRDVIRSIYDFLGKQRERIGKDVVERGITLAARDQFELELISRLRVVNEAYASTRILAFARGVHPFPAYWELCRIVGQLAIFRHDRMVPDPPLYDHDDLATIFLWVKDQIFDAFQTGDEPRYEQEYFTGLGPGMHVSIKPKWFDDWQWFVGVARGTLSEQECRHWLSPGCLNWKMGSAGKVDEYWSRGVAGLELTPVEKPPSVFPSRGGWTYFEVNRQHPTFRHVQAEKSLAVRFSSKYIQNLGDLQGKRDLQVEVQGKQVTLQFALFALKQASR